SSLSVTMKRPGTTPDAPAAKEGRDSSIGMPCGVDGPSAQAASTKATRTNANLLLMQRSSWRGAMGLQTRRPEEGTKSPIPAKDCVVRRDAPSYWGNHLDATTILYHMSISSMREAPTDARSASVRMTRCGQMTRSGDVPRLCKQV